MQTGMKRSVVGTDLEAIQAGRGVSAFTKWYTSFQVVKLEGITIYVLWPALKS
jgi:hypothetical protein